MNRNATLHLLAILAAGASGFAVPSILLALMWNLLEQGQWLYALGALVALVGYLLTVREAVRGMGTRTWRWDR